MMKTFRKLWQVVDISVDLVVDMMKAIQREINSPDEPTPPKSE